MHNFYEWIEIQSILGRLNLFQSEPISVSTQPGTTESSKMNWRRFTNGQRTPSTERPWRRCRASTGLPISPLRFGGRDGETSEVQEKADDLVTKLLIGTLFRGFDEKVSGPMDLRFKRSVANGVRNLVRRSGTGDGCCPPFPLGRSSSLERSRRTSCLDGRATHDEAVVDNFRQLVRSRLGQLGLAVLDARLAGQETKSLIGRADLVHNKNII